MNAGRVEQFAEQVNNPNGNKYEYRIHTTAGQTSAWSAWTVSLTADELATRIATETAAREAADTALSGRLDVIEGSHIGGEPAVIAVTPGRIDAIEDLDGDYNLDVRPTDFIPDDANFLEVWVGNEAVHSVDWAERTGPFRIPFTIDETEETNIAASGDTVLVRAVFYNRQSGASRYRAEAGTLLKVEPASEDAPDASLGRRVSAVEHLTSDLSLIEHEGWADETDDTVAAVALVAAISSEIDIPTVSSYTYGVSASPANANSQNVYLRLPIATDTSKARVLQMRGVSVESTFFGHGWISLGQDDTYKYYAWTGGANVEIGDTFQVQSTSKVESTRYEGELTEGNVSAAIDSTLTGLDERIGTEVTDRQNADTALGTRIDAKADQTALDATDARAVAADAAAMVADGKAVAARNAAAAAQLDEDTVILAGPAFEAAGSDTTGIAQRNLYISIRHPINSYPDADIIHVSVEGLTPNLQAYTPGSLQQDITVGIQSSEMDNLASNNNFVEGNYVGVEVRLTEGRNGPIHFLRWVDVPVIAAPSATEDATARAAAASAQAAAEAAQTTANIATTPAEATTIADARAALRFTDAEKTKLASLTSVFRARGAFAVSTAYAVGDVVSYQSHLYYIAVAVPATNTDTPVDGSTYILLSADPTPSATESQEGTVELATQTEMNDGTADKVPDAAKAKTYVDAQVTTVSSAAAAAQRAAGAAASAASTADGKAVAAQGTADAATTAAARAQATADAATTVAEATTIANTRAAAVAGPVLIISNIASFDTTQNRFEDSSGNEVVVPNGAIVTLTQAVYDAAVADTDFTPNANAIFLTR